MRKCCGCKYLFLSAVSLDDQYVLVRPESDWHWDKQSMEYALEKIDSVLSNVTPIGQYKMQNADCRLGAKRRTEKKDCFSSDT